MNSTIGFLQLWTESQQAMGAPNSLYNTATNTSLNYVEGVDFENRTEFDDKIYLRGDDDNSTTLSGNIRNPSNSSLVFGSADIFSDQSDIDAFEVWGFVKFFNGGFVIDSMDRFAGALGMTMPVGFVDSIAVVIGLLFVMWMFFLITGRSFSPFV